MRGVRSGGRNRKTPTLQLSEMLECGWVYGIVLCLNVVVHPVSEKTVSFEFSCI